MDLGTTRTFSISCVRVTPDDFDDDSKNPDRWSNGKWWEEFMHMWDYWQNLSYEKDGSGWRIQGGVDFKYMPDSGTYEEVSDEIPEISTNVFLTGTMAPRFGVQKMTWSMQLLEARVFSEEDAGARVTLTFKLDSSDSGFSRSYPVGTQAYMPEPSAEQLSKITDGGIVVGWDYNGIRYDIGKKLIISTGMDGGVFYAIRVYPKYIYTRLLSRVDEDPITVPEGCSRAVVTVVGAGGRGGDIQLKGITQPGGSIKNICYSGGGGGSGEVQTKTFTGLVAGDRIEVSLGQGLFYTSDERFTVATLKSASGSLKGRLTANGGEDGEDATIDSKGGRGGSKYNAGGSTDGRAGEPGEGSIGIPGKGTAKVPSDDESGGGAGGGAADLNMNLPVSAILNAKEYTLDPDIKLDWKHGQWTYDSIYAAYNIEVTDIRNSGTMYVFAGTVKEEGPYWFLIQIQDKSLGRKRLYNGGAGIYLKNENSDGRSINIRSKGGDGVVPYLSNESGYNGSDALKNIGSFGGGAGSGSVSAALSGNQTKVYSDAAGDGVVIASFLE